MTTIDQVNEPNMSGSPDVELADADSKREHEAACSDSNCSGHDHQPQTETKTQTTDTAKGRLYLAGPMTGFPDWNAADFDKAKKVIELSTGWEVISPVDLDRRAGVVDLQPSEVTPDLMRSIVQRDINAILSCDALAYLHHSERSKCAMAEIAVARWLKLPIYQYHPRAIGRNYPLMPIINEFGDWHAAQDRRQLEALAFHAAIFGQEYLAIEHLAETMLDFHFGKPELSSRTGRN